MLFPLAIKRILHRIKVSYENVIIRNENTRFYKKYSEWFEEYYNLTPADKKNILKKFERLQTATIIYGMRKRDPEIFINQLGVFYIKPTTLDYYRKLEELTSGKNPDEYSFEEVHKSALEECRSLYIQRSNNKKNAKETKHIEFKI